MVEYQKNFWKLKLQTCAEALSKNNFETHIADDCEQAAVIFNEQIRAALKVTSASFGDSMSLLATPILDQLKADPRIRFIDTFERGIPRDELIERRRQALLVDLFLTGSNAVTEKGQLVNLDMVGNRVGGITFGPRHVVLVIGRNKVVADIESAFMRIRRQAAPLNGARHKGWKIPCIKTGRCMDCKSPQRICNTWVITEKSYPKGRIKVILVNEELGL